MGSKIRAVLKARTGAPTIPQIYIGGTHVGGCTDLFDAMRSGRMQQLLGAAGVAYDRNVQLDPYGLLPKWLHPRKSA
jgi:cysteine synthase A